MPSQRSLRFVAFATLLTALVVRPAFAYEADVHFGLTRWLAMQAGFTAAQADHIAQGNHGEDAGTMRTQFVMWDFACRRPSVEEARAFQRIHYSTTAEAIASVNDVTHAASGPPAFSRAGSMLMRFGAALHAYQDAQAHEGISMPLGTVGAAPDGKAPGCEALVSMTRKGGRGDESPHRWDRTDTNAERTREMAATTYALLQQYPAISSHRNAAPWQALRQKVDAFIAARTKTEKAAWFVAQDFADTSFLDGVTLPDGATEWRQKWQGRRLPALRWAGASADRRQIDIPIAARLFWDRFFSAWLLSDDPGRATAGLVAADQRREVAARLRLWRMRDHGSAARLVHLSGPLAERDQLDADAMTHKPAAYARYASMADAVLPLMPIEDYPPPLAPYIVWPLDQAGRRLMAVAKLSHAPYDEVGIVAERRDDKWSVVAVRALVAH